MEKEEENERKNERKDEEERAAAEKWQKTASKTVSTQIKEIIIIDKNITN